MSGLLPVLSTAEISCGGERGSIGRDYLDSLLEILETIREKEAESIRDASNLFAGTLVSRNHCFLYTGYEFLAAYVKDPLSGLPGVFVPVASEAMAATAGESDALLTTHTGAVHETIRSRGTKVVGIVSPAVPGGFEHTSRAETGTAARGDITDMIIRSRLPARDGLVTVPEYPSGILPGSGPVLLTLMNAIAGETYERSGGIALTDAPSPGVAFTAIDTVVERIERIRRDYGTVAAAGETIAECILEGGRVWLYDSRGITAKELANGGGVPLFVRPVDERRIYEGGIAGRDVLIFSTLESNAPGDMNLMRHARNATENIVSICPHDGAGGYRIFRDASIGVDNMSCEREGVLSFDYGTRRFIKAAQIMNSVLFWTMIGEAVGRLLRSGIIPSFLADPRLPGGGKHNAEAERRFEEPEY